MHNQPVCGHSHFQNTAREFRDHASTSEITSRRPTRYGEQLWSAAVNDAKSRRFARQTSSATNLHWSAGQRKSRKMAAGGASKWTNFARLRPDNSSTGGVPDARASCLATAQRPSGVVSGVSKGSVKGHDPTVAPSPAHAGGAGGSGAARSQRLMSP